MRVLQTEVPYQSRTDRFRLVFIADVHLGSRYCDERLLKATVQSIAEDETALWLGLGDMCEWINRKDVRFQESEIAGWLWGIDDIAGEQRRRCEEIFKPIAPKCVGLIEGNHEADIRIRADRDVYRMLVEAMVDERLKMGIKSPLALGTNGFVRLVFRRCKPNANWDTWTCAIYATHGNVGGRRMGAKALRLEDLHRSQVADIIVMGHAHTPMVLPSMVRREAGRKDQATVRQTHLISASTFLGTAELGWPEYAERKDYPPSMARPPVEAIIVPDKQEITIKV